MSAKHTPGPWAVDPDDRPGMAWNNHIVLEQDKDMRICFMANTGLGPKLEEGIANTHLIAAAPELLEALNAAEQYLHDMLYAGVLKNDGSHNLHIINSTIRAAIAKAKGGAA